MSWMILYLGHRRELVGLVKQEILFARNSDKNIQGIFITCAAVHCALDPGMNQWPYIC